MNVIKFLTVNKLIYLLGLLSYMMAFNIYSKPDWKQCMFDQPLYKDLNYQFCYPIMLYESGQFGRMRLFGNYYSNTKLINRAFPPHECFVKAEMPGYNIPQDPVAALIQWLFLSQDGVNLALNERTGDPVGKMGLEQLDQIIQMVISHQQIEESKIEAILQPTSPQQQEKCKQFALILKEACNYDMLQTDLLYPRNIVCYSLMAFGYCKANQPKDLFCLTSIFKPNALTLWQTQGQQVFSLTQYDRDIGAFVHRLTQGGSVSPQEIMMFTLGFREFYTAPNPLMYRKIFTEKQYRKIIPEYCDCGETSLRNVIYLILMTAEKIEETTIGELISKVPTKTPPFQHVIDYIHKYRTLDGSIDAYQDWAKCTMKLNQVPGAPEAIRYQISDAQVEISAGMINMMKVVGALFPVGELQKNFIGSEIEQLRQVSAKLNEFCKLLEHSGVKADWVSRATGRKEILENFGDIVFYRSGKQWLTWTFQKGHFSVETNPESIKEYWGNDVSLDNPNLRNNDMLQLQFASVQKFTSTVFKPYLFWNIVTSNSLYASSLIRCLALTPNPLHYAALIHMLSARFDNVLDDTSYSMILRLVVLTPTIASVLFPGELERFKWLVITHGQLRGLLYVCSKEEVQLILSALPTWFPDIYASRILAQLADVVVPDLIQSGAFGQARCVITDLEIRGRDIDLGLSSCMREQEVGSLFGATYRIPDSKQQDPRDVAYIIDWLIAKYKKCYNITPGATSYPPKWNEVIKNAFYKAVQTRNDVAIRVLIDSGIWDHQIQIKRPQTWGYFPDEKERPYELHSLVDELNKDVEMEVNHDHCIEEHRRAESIRDMLYAYERSRGWKQ